jgi:hypothetical protein
MKKYYIFLISFALVLILASCGESQKPVATETTTEEVPVTEVTDLSRSYADELFSENDFDGRVLHFVYMSEYYLGKDESEITYDSEELSGDVLKEAVYQRTSRVEEGLNVGIETENRLASGFSQYVTQQVMAGDGSLDCVVQYKRYNSELAMTGVFYNLRNIPTLKLENAWWDQNFNALYSYVGNTRQYIATGDMLYNDNYTSSALFFNQSIMDDLKIEYPYDDVRAGTWTLDRFYGMISEGNRDLDGNSVQDGNDQWGFSANAGMLNNMMACCRMTPVSFTTDGGFSLCFETDADRYFSVGEKIWNIVSSPYNCKIESVLNDNYTLRTDLISAGHFLFWDSAIGGTITLRSVSDYDFGIVPYPKYDETQEKYACLSSAWASTVAISGSAEKPEEIGTVLEAMAAVSVYELTPVAIERQIIVKAMRDEDSAEMLQLCFNNMVYDLLFDYGWGGYYEALCKQNNDSSFTLSSMLTAQKSKIYESLEKGINTYAELTD